MTKQAQGRELNKLLRYKEIKELYDEYDRLGVPTTTIHDKYIYPKYFISRGTLDNILCTPINKRLEEIKAAQPQQMQLDF